MRGLCWMPPGSKQRPAWVFRKAYHLLCSLLPLSQTDVLHSSYMVHSRDFRTGFRQRKNSTHFLTTSKQNGVRERASRRLLLRRRVTGNFSAGGDGGKDSAAARPP